MTDPSPLARRSFLRAVGAGAGLATVGALAGCTSDGRTDATSDPDDNLGFAGTVLGIPVDKPTLAFTDTSGAPYDLAAETAGKLTLMLFGYTSCPDVCPVHLNIIAAALDGLEGPAKFTKVVFVGVDSARDTPETIRTFLDKRDKEFVGLVPTDPTQLDGALTKMQLPGVIIDPPRADGSYTVQHPSQIMAFTPDDDRCHIVYPYGIREAAWRKDLPRLVDMSWPDTSR